MEYTKNGTLRNLENEILGFRNKSILFLFLFYVFCMK